MTTNIDLTTPMKKQKDNPATPKDRSEGKPLNPPPGGALVTSTDSKYYISPFSLGSIAAIGLSAFPGIGGFALPASILTAIDAEIRLSKSINWVSLVLLGNANSRASNYRASIGSFRATLVLRGGQLPRISRLSRLLSSKRCRHSDRGKYSDESCKRSSVLLPISRD